MTAGPLRPHVRRGPGYWLRSYLVMMRWEAASLRMWIPVATVVQLLVGAGMAIGIGFFFGDAMPQGVALFLATGVP